MYSIIIPVWNEEKHIVPLVESILKSNFKDYEIIIVDDNSTDNSVEKIKKYPVRAIRLKENSGAAKARNIGAKFAKGNVLLFLDSDVIVHEDTLKEIDKTFREKPDAKVVIGMYSKNPVNRGFFPKFKALLDYHIFISSKSEKVTSFEPRCGAVDKKLFEETGGFDTKFKGATVEDYEFGYRLLKKSNMYINKNAQVDHNFDGFRKTAKNFLKRGYMWFQMFLKRKKFDNVGTTQGTAFFRGFTFLSLILFLSSIFYFKIIYVALLSFIISVFGNLKFYRLILKETNLFFLLGGIVVDFILSVLLGISAIAAIITYPFKAKHI